jgi:5-methylcytosine rRNA methyltransferase NSUN4
MHEAMTRIKSMADYYREQYGQETDQLFEALGTTTDKIALINPWLTSEQLADILCQGQPEIIFGMTLYRLPKDCAPQQVGGLMSHYFLDRSSVMAPLLLPLEPGMRVLDMCSAPGGKLLVMLSRMLKASRFVGNDVSKTRALRLKKVVAGFVPKDIIAASVDLTIKDAHYFGLARPGSFDAVLLDAPCSSEAHVVEQAKLAAKFNGPQKGLPQRQYSLLAAALLALKPGGHVMYATCTINKHENEGVIDRILRKKSAMCSLVDLSLPIGVQSPFGWSILPHIHGMGPAFLSLLRRA